VKRSCDNNLTILLSAELTHQRTEIRHASSALRNKQQGPGGTKKALSPRWRRNEFHIPTVEGREKQKPLLTPYKSPPIKGSSYATGLRNQNSLGEKKGRRCRDVGISKKWNKIQKRKFQAMKKSGGKESEQGGP